MTATNHSSECEPIRPDANILAVAVGRIGDTVLLTPALRALKAHIPLGRLTVLAHPKRARLLAGLDFIDKLGTIDKRSAFWRGRLPRSRTADVAIVWGSDRALFEYGLRRANRLVAFESPALPQDSRVVRVSAPATALHAIRERLLLIEAIGIRCDNLRTAYNVSKDEQDYVRRWLAEVGLGHPMVGIQPVSFATKSHRDWPLAHFRTLLQRLASDHPEVGFVILGDKHSQRAFDDLGEIQGVRIVSAAGKFDVRMAAALIGELDLYVGVDTGPTHIAGALNVPMIGLYHCSYPGRNLIPFDHPALRMIEHPATARPEAATQRSMAEIPAEAVHKAAIDLLERRSVQ